MNRSTENKLSGSPRHRWDIYITTSSPQSSENIIEEWAERLEEPEVLEDQVVTISSGHHVTIIVHTRSTQDQASQHSSIVGEEHTSPSP